MSELEALPILLERRFSDMIAATTERRLSDWMEGNGKEKAPMREAG